MIEPVIATQAARTLIERLREQHGNIFFYQSHGCCEGSSPMCFAAGELTLGDGDVQLGTVDGVPFHVSRSQCEVLAGLQLILDLAPGDAGTFSLENGSGQHFVARLRLWSDDEALALRAQPASH